MFPTVYGTGEYQSRKSTCPQGTKEVTFEEGTDMDELLQAVSTMTEASDGFFLNVTTRGFFWINSK